MRNQPLLGLCVLLVTSCLCSAAEFKVGCAAVEITPPIGMPLGSGYVYSPSRGVHDPLWAKAMVIESDGSRAAIVACDSMGLPRRIIEPARALIRDRVGLPAERVMVVATHTHSGPGTDPVPVSFLKDPEAKIASEYFEALPTKIAESVSQALANMVAARIWAGVARESAVSFNRRYLMKDGSVGWNPGRLNPDIVRPAGPIDPDLPVVYLDTPEGRPLLTFLNFPLQVAVVAGSAGNRFSADYSHTIATALANVKGTEMLTMFTGGAWANVNHVNVNDPKQLGGLAEAARIGTILAADVLRL